MAKPFTPGSMFVGCNYWASHAGTNMWKEWDETVIRKDFHRLTAVGIRVLRVFPLWSDFQPLRMHYGHAGEPREIRMGEAPLPFTEAGQAGVSEVILARFRRFMDLAYESGIQLVVGLLTGWMSGRLHAPEMLQGRNLLVDPLAIRWEIRFVRLMVRQFRAHPALLAWDLGNECNCMGKVENADQFYVWTATIANTIRAEDAGHPLISGMHGMRPMTPELPEDQGELNDIVCTHPYPKFTPHCDTDPLTGMKSALHAAAESRMYADLAGKPCFVEEAGPLGPMFASPENAADYLQSMLLSTWRYDCLGLMWWCAFDQEHLSQTPYDWNAVERQLGLLALSGEKPAAGVMKRFDAFIRRLPVDCLPARSCDAVCILTRGQDNWAVAYGSFILACQAKLELRFAWCDQEIPDAPVYMLPSLSGDDSISRHQLHTVLKRVCNGATLYLSLDDAIMSPFEAFTGLQVMCRTRRTGNISFRFEGQSYAVPAQYTLSFAAKGADVHIKDDGGAPFMSRFQYGAGVVWLINAPIEKLTSTLPGVTDGPNRLPLYKLYRHMDLRSDSRAFDCEDPLVGMSEYSDGAHIWLFVQNYGPEDREAALVCREAGKVVSIDSPGGRAKIVSGDGMGLTLSIPHHDGCLLRIERG